MRSRYSPFRHVLVHVHIVGALLLLAGPQSARAFVSPLTHRSPIVTATAVAAPFVVDDTRIIYSLHSQRTALLATKQKGNARNGGVYSRPSAAIERGSGFFIPGLEGERVRLVFGLVVLILTAVNHNITTTGTNIFSEGIAIFYAVLLLLQAAIEFGKNEMGYTVSLDNNKDNNRPESLGERGEDELSSTSGSDTLSQRWTTASEEALVSDAFKDAVQWSAASYISLTPASHMMLLENDRVLYRLGSATSGASSSSEEETRGTQAAIETVNLSKGGRVSLPPTHPAVTTLINEEHGRCVVLQRISDTQCWMMTSNQLIQAFTNQDLKWLGQLALHVGSGAKQ